MAQRTKRTSKLPKSPAFVLPRLTASSLRPFASPPAGLQRQRRPRVTGRLTRTRCAAAGVAGTVVKVVVQPGQVIQPGDTLLVLEAMKMETNITAPVAGKVRSVRVSAGDAVRSGQIVVELE
jgi:biotin carboxyl carrier protein